MKRKQKPKRKRKTLRLPENPVEHRVRNAMRDPLQRWEHRHRRSR